MRDILVDTSIWSLAFRRKRESREREILKNLIYKGRVVLIGPIRQEVLSGISRQENFLALNSKLSAFSDHKIETKEYELAARFSNTCRRNGIQGSHTDFLICAVAVSYNLTIFSTDKDFELYAEYLPISLYK